MSAFNSIWAIIGISAVIILSFLFNFLARKVNIPSVILLILLGFGIQQLISSWGIQMMNVMPVLEIIGIIGLIMIVLEAAMDLKLKKDKGGLIIKSFFVAFILLIVTSLSVASIFIFFLHMEPFNALIYAVPLSIMSSAIIIPSVANLSEEKKEFMIYEATFSDILGIMLFYFLLDSKTMSGNKEILTSISMNIVITIVVSFVVSYILVFILQYAKIQGRLFLIVALLTMLYAVGKLFHLSSLVIILIFGLLLNNQHIFFRRRFKNLIDKEAIDRTLGDFKILIEESSFVIRTFFFVLFGMSIVIGSLNNLFFYLITFFILIVLYATRYVNLKFFTGSNTFPLLFIAPRGLITILLFYAIPQEMQSPYFDMSILLLTILSTSLIMMFALMSSGKKISDLQSLKFDSHEIDGAVTSTNATPIPPTEQAS